MQTRRRDSYSTITTAGSILPSDLLQRVAAFDDKALGHLTPDAYHLAGGERLGEATNRAWNRLVGIWESFRTAREALPASDRGTTLTREKWLLPLFSELGYGRLVTARAIEIDGKSYPVSHGWQHTPIHLVSFRLDLDRRGEGARAGSPHGMAQELLNRSKDHLWAFVSNGLRLRLLRDNVSLTRQAYVEFDLEAMMDGSAYADFALMWLLCHQSRFEADRPEESVIERWSKTAEKQGTRVREQLRGGVEQAIARLGAGFLRHPANGELRAALESGALDVQEYYRQLLRQVYRLLFLFVAEDRDVLLDPVADDAARERYERYYSTARLRRLAERRRGTRHADLWRGFRLVVDLLGSDGGCAGLGLPALGGFLFSSAATAALNGCDVENSDFLDAIRELAFTVEGYVRRPVDYERLQSEELGSIYESLLELHPALDLGAASFELAVAAGNERKTTGSYYTPESLVQCLLDSALDPVLEEATGAPDPEAAILALKVCDPACGSGHFLVAAAHRIAKRLAAVRAGGEPSPGVVRAALREVIGRCVFGVDVNPMAVELCKVSLWMEALEPGKPLSFLDHHIRCGNSLLGATPALVAKGIPDAAFDTIEGDDRGLARDLKAQNKLERKRRERDAGRGLFAIAEREELALMAKAVESIADARVSDVHEKERRWHAMEASDEARRERFLADAWCAAFVAPKVEGAAAITEDVFRALAEGGEPSNAAREMVASTAAEYAFLHWHLAFPQVFRVPDDPAAADNSETGWSGGFDVVMGNPPWERVKLQEKEWFGERRPEVAAAANAARRKEMIEALRSSDLALHAAWLGALRRSDGESALVRRTGRYPLCGRGDINTYAIFAELNQSLIGPRGRAGFIVPSGIATDDTTKLFFQSLVGQTRLASLFHFENEDRVFPGVHHAYRFVLLTITGAGVSIATPTFVAYARQVAEVQYHEKRYGLSTTDIRRLNPNTQTLALFRHVRDAEITTKIFRRVPVLIDESKGVDGNPWGLTFLAMLHMSNDSGIFETASEMHEAGGVLNGNIFDVNGKRYLPLYEAKMVHQFDHRYGTYEGQTEAQANVGTLPPVTDEQHDDPAYTVRPRYWVAESAVEDRLRDRWPHGWLLGWRDITGAEKQRTVIASVIPRVAVGHTVPLMLSQHGPARSALLLAVLASFAFDFVARQKIGGTHLTYGYLKQLPLPEPDQFEAVASWSGAATLGEWATSRTLELCCTATDLNPLARDLNYVGPPFRWNPERRFLIRAELDAAFFHLYGIKRDDVDYIMDTFPIVRRKDEAAHGEYRTKHVILELYDAMQRAIETGEPYRTPLDPPPGDPRAAHPAETAHE